MAFNSIGFLYFFPAVLLLYWAAPARFRWCLLLVASYTFYLASKPVYLLILGLVTVTDWSVAWQMSKRQDRAWRKRWLFVSLTTNLGLLIFFKYYNFIAGTLQSIATYFRLPLEFFRIETIPPLGISFFVFQTLSYTIDVYRNQQKPESSLPRYALFLSFFPQLAAGPIGRAKKLFPQHRAEHRFDYDQMKSGLQLMLWGFFKKLVIADRLAIYVNQVFDHPKDHHGWAVIVAIYFFAYQIYCDFSGYTDIARGCAQCLGYDLAQNFRRPYAAASIRDFWERWHISLTTWFRDYLFFALGVSRTHRLRNYFNVMVVFLVCGLWHGASWTFVLWGAFHGVLIVGSLAFKGFRQKVAELSGLAKVPRVRRAIQLAITFHLVLLAWVFFRMNSFADLGVLFHNLYGFDRSSLFFNGGLDLAQMTVALVAVGLLEGIQLAQARMHIREWLTVQPIGLRWAVYYAALFAVILLAADSDAVQFIYFQF